MTTAPATAPAPAPSQAGRPRLRIRLFRVASTSVLATVISQATFIGLLWSTTNPTLASAVGFACGAVPNYFLARNWAWGRKGKPKVARELLPYLTVISITGLASVGLTTLAGRLIEPLEIAGFLRIVVLDAAFLSSYALVFVMKFLLLDRLVFAGEGAERIPAATSRS